MKSIVFNSAAALLMLSFVPGCSDGDILTGGSGGSGGGSGGNAGSGGESTTGGGGSGGSTMSAAAPTILSTVPVDGASDVALNAGITAIFSEPMDCATLGGSTFTLATTADAVAVPGSVVCSAATAVFWPTAHLAADGMYTATITTGAQSAAGSALKKSHTWTFKTGLTLAPGLGVNLGAAGDYVILAKAAISTVAISNITGNLGVSPAAASFITGFSLTADATNVFSTSAQVSGKVFAADYAPPTPANLTTAIGDMEIAFTSAAARAPDVTELGAGDIGGMTLAPGVYKWGTGLLIPTSVTLSGSATDVWIFQIAQGLTVNSATNVVLAGGALPQNVYWQVGTLVDIGTTAHFQGVVLAKTGITLKTGASVNGRLFAQTMVAIGASMVVEPTQ